jgi:hypothetical protein
LERRKNPRFRLDLPCRLALGKGEEKAQLLDVADGGLAVRTSASACQGDSVHVTILPRAAPPITVETLAWHVRRHRASSGRSTYIMGLVVSQASDEYDALVQERAKLAERPSPGGLRALRPLGPAAKPGASSSPLPPRPPVSAHPGAETAPDSVAEDPPAPDETNDEVLESLPMFRIRLGKGPRTKRVCIAAADCDEARRAATEGFGKEWAVLEISQG